jgi:hypothetical protein
MFLRVYKFFTGVELVRKDKVDNYIAELQDRVAELEQRLRAKKKAKYLKEFEVKEIEAYFVGKDLKANKDDFLELSIRYGVSITTIKRIYYAEHKLSTNEYKNIKGKK